MAATQPYINGRVYDWASIKLVIAGGFLPTNFSAIAYGDEHADENVYGQGIYPIGYKRGNVTPSASFTFGMGDLQLMRTRSLDGSLHGLGKFDIVVSYGSFGQVPVKHVIKNFGFLSDMIDVKQGDAVGESVTGLPSHIEWSEKGRIVLGG